MAAQDKYFESNEFKQLLRRYEEAKQDGSACYLDADDYMDISDYYLGMGKTKKALEAADDGLAVHGDDEGLVAVRIGVLIYLHRFEEALHELADIDPEDNPDAYYLQGQLQLAVNDNPAEADKLFHLWLNQIEEEWGFGRTSEQQRLFSYDDEEEEVDNDEVQERVRDAYLHVITSYGEFGNPASRQEYQRKWANAYLHQFSTLGHYSADYELADVCRNAYLVEEVEKIYAKLLEYDPYLPDGWSTLAAAQQISGHYEDALSSCEFALAINPNDSNAYLTQGYAFANLGNQEQTKESLLKYRELTGNHNADHILANCYIEEGEDKLAEQCLDNAMLFQDESIAAAEERAWNYNDIANAYINIVRSKKAEKAINKALEIDDSPMQFHLTRGSIYLMQRNLERAKECFTEVAKRATCPQEALYLVGIRFMSYAYFDETLACLEELEKMGADAETTNINSIFALMAYCYLQNPDTVDKAWEYLKKACDLDPKSAAGMFSDLLPKNAAVEDYYDLIRRNWARKNKR